MLLDFSLSNCLQKGMLFFEVAQFDGILKKISEFNNSLLTEVVNFYRGSKVLSFLLIVMVGTC